METIIRILKALYQASFGIFASPTVITGTSPIPCNGVSFTAISNDVVIASITINGTDITSFSSITLAQGQTIKGIITSVTLSAGTGIVYSGELI